MSIFIEIWINYFLHRRKRKSTKDPLYPSGTFRPVEFLRRLPHHGLAVNPELFDTLRSVADGYEWTTPPRVFDAIPDPLVQPNLLLCRSILMEWHFPISDRPTSRDFPTLCSMYRAMRFFTKVLVQLQDL